MAAKAQIFQTLLAGLRFDGTALSGGTVTFYSPGTLTKKAVYLDRNKTAQAANPYTLNSNGQAELFGDGTYDVVVKSSAGVTKATWENVSLVDVYQFANIDNYASLNAAVTAIGTTPTRLLINSATTMTGALVIPSTLELEITRAGSINQGAYTLAFSGTDPIAGSYQIFAGSGTVIGLKKTTPQMFGAIADGNADDSAAMLKAIGALKPNGGHFHMPKGVYNLNNHVYADFSNLMVTGDGIGVSIIKVGAWVDGFRVSNGYPSPTTVLTNIVMRDFSINGNRDGYTNGANDTYGNGINLNSVSNAIIENVEVYNVAEQGIVSTFFPVTTERQTALTIQNCIIRNTQPGRIAIGAEGHAEMVSIHKNNIINGGYIAISNIGETGTSTNGKISVNNNNIVSTTFVSSPAIWLSDNMIGADISLNTINNYDIGIRVSYFDSPVSPIKDCIIIGNVIDHYVTSGILVFPVLDTDVNVLINSNRLKTTTATNADTASILVTHDCQVVGNKIKTNGLGIQLLNDNNLAASNFIDSSTNYSIRFSGNYNIAVCNKVSSLIDDLGTNNNHFANYGGTGAQGSKFSMGGRDYSASGSMPSSGTHTAGKFVFNTNPTIGGAAPNQYVVLGWMRVTTGSNNVLNTDWVESRALVGF